MLRRAFVHAYNSVRLCGSQPGADDGKEHAGRVGVRSSTIACSGILRVDPVNVPALNRRARCYREGMDLDHLRHANHSNTCDTHAREFSVQ